MDGRRAEETEETAAAGRAAVYQLGVVSRMQRPHSHCTPLPKDRLGVVAAEDGGHALGV